MKAMSRPTKLRLLALAAGLAAVALVAVVTRVGAPGWTSPYDPPVLAGQQLWGSCSGGFYARRETTIVLTSTGHCASEGTVALGRQCVDETVAS